MRHDEHFLARVQRLDREHVELALGLYYDSKLVTHILEVAGVPEGAERTALCLGTPEDGPFIIVARDGHFVTALGEGMKISDDLPVVSRHRLDQISETASTLREIVAEAHAGRGKQTRKLLRGIFRAGPGLSQEEFDELSAWLPLLQGKFLLAYFEAAQRSYDVFQTLCRQKKLKPRHDELLHDFWRDAWAKANLTMLLASDGGAVARKLFTTLEAENPGRVLELSSNLMRLGQLCFAARATWIASKLPTLMVPAAKRRYATNSARLIPTLSDATSLIAAGLRHRRYRREVGKVLNKARGALEGAEPGDVIRYFAQDYYPRYLSDMQTFRDHVADSARTFMRKLCEPLSDAGLPSFDGLSDQIPIALLLNAPFEFRSQASAIRVLFDQIPSVVELEARDFYLPQPFVRISRGPWTRELGLDLFRACTGGGIRRAQPVCVGPKIGRNAPCPCGSDRKYKRCCGKPGADAAR